MHIVVCSTDKLSQRRVGGASQDTLPLMTQGAQASNPFSQTQGFSQTHGFSQVRGLSQAEFSQDNFASNARPFDGMLSQEADNKFSSQFSQFSWFFGINQLGDGSKNSVKGLISCSNQRYVHKLANSIKYESMTNIWNISLTQTQAHWLNRVRFSGQGMLRNPRGPGTSAEDISDPALHTFASITL